MKEYDRKRANTSTFASHLITVSYTSQQFSAIFLSCRLAKTREDDQVGAIFRMVVVHSANRILKVATVRLDDLIAPPYLL